MYGGVPPRGWQREQKRRENGMSQRRIIAHGHEGTRPVSPALAAQPPVLVVAERPLEEALHTFWLLALLKLVDQAHAITRASVTHPLGWQDAWVRLGRN